MRAKLVSKALLKLSSFVFFFLLNVKAYLIFNCIKSTYHIFRKTFSFVLKFMEWKLNTQSYFDLLVVLLVLEVKLDELLNKSTEK